jgi:hypothetical protein
MKQNDNKTVMSNRYDLAGNGINRVGKHYLLSKMTRIGNFGGGPGIKTMMMALFMHFFAKPMGWMLVFFEPQLRKVFARLSHYLGKHS